MIHQTARLAAIVSTVGLLGGCSSLGYVSMASGLTGNGGGGGDSGGYESYVRVWLDNNLAEPTQGRSKISQTISHGPKVRYEVTQPEKIGKITNVTINIFHEFDGGWSQNVDFIVVAADSNNPDAQMKPGKVYDLGSRPDELRVMDGQGNEVKGVRLERDTKYLMNFVVRADRSETVSIEFRTQ